MWTFHISLPPNGHSISARIITYGVVDQVGQMGIGYGLWHAEAWARCRVRPRLGVWMNVETGDECTNTHPGMHQRKIHHMTYNTLGISRSGGQRERRTWVDVTRVLIGIALVWAGGGGHGIRVHLKLVV